MNTRVVIGCSDWRDYSFLLPLTALFWREVVGYEPLLLLVGDWNTNARTTITRKALDQYQFQYTLLGTLDGYEVSTFAQNARQHGAALKLPSDDWLMLSDADLWPLAREFYHQHDPAYRMAFYYANAYSSRDENGRYTHHCTCHMAGSVASWREVMDLIPDGDVAGQVKQTLDGWLKPRQQGKAPSEAGWVAWNSDEWRTSELIRARPWYPSECQFIERKGGPPCDRIDRSAWPELPQVKGMTDAHLPRAADQPGTWERVVPIVEQLLPGRVDWANAYRKDYVGSY